MTSPEPAAIPPQAITAAAKAIVAIADDFGHGDLVAIDYAKAARAAVEAAAPHLAAYDPRDFGLTATDLHAVADRLYDCADSRLDPMDDVSVRFGQIRSHLRSLADAIESREQP